MASTEDRQITTTRIFPHPKHIVFNAWTDPEQLQLWWGPKGFTNTFHQFDLKPGGKWHFTMHGPDGRHYHNECEFVDIQHSDKIIWEHLSDHLFRVVAEFREHPLGTEVIFTMIFPSQEECEKVRSIVQDSNEENFDRLETHLYGYAIRK